MTSISDKRFHTRDFMSRVLRRAAQFAHVGAEEIERQLSQLYLVPQSRQSGEDREANRLAVPGSVVRLYRADAIPMMFAAQGTIDYFEKKFSLLCPLCLAVGNGSWWSGDRKLTLFVSPEYLWTTESYQGSICHPCARVAGRIFENKRYGGFSAPKTDEMMAVGLANLLSNLDFRKRVFANRKRQIRFNPRRTFAKDFECSVHPPLQVSRKLYASIKWQNPNAPFSRVYDWNMITRVARASVRCGSP